MSLGTLTKVDYDNIVSGYAANTGTPITESSALNIKMTKVDFPINGMPTEFSTTTVGGNSAINITHTLGDIIRPPAAYTDITFNFTKHGTTEKVFITNVALNAFDIDRSVATRTINPSTGLAYSNFDDAIMVMGNSQSGTIAGTIQSGLGGSDVEDVEGGLLRMRNFANNCPAKDLGSLCQASIKFEQAVSSVTVRYTNTDRLRPISQSDTGVIDPTTEQQIDIRLDSYCYTTPPKLTVTKVLSDDRINNKSSDRDQFEISIKEGTTTLNSFTTSGSGKTITPGTGTSGLVTLKENTLYTVTERLTSTSRNISNYNANYACTNATTGSTTVMPTGAMTYNTTDKTRSFTLLNVNSSDNVTCTITNSKPVNYIFSGTIFNDNGGITDTQANANTIGGIYNNNQYFNGEFDRSTESSIFASDLKVRLTNCSGSNITTTQANPQTVSGIPASLGSYSFTVALSSLTNITALCIEEIEPSNWQYTVDTTPDIRPIPFIASTYSYPNLDFGEVKAANAALVLKKYQYVHDCNNTLSYSSVNDDTALPTTGFSMNDGENVMPGKCIAYKIEAYNRGHIDLENVKISDTLQHVTVKSVFHLPKPLGYPVSLFQSSNTSAVIGENGTIKSDFFNLAKSPSFSTTPTKATLYFNSKYGTTLSK